MSGIAGIFHLDDAPVDRAWLEKMADFLGFRGPDGSYCWLSGSAGLCHTLLRTSETDGARPRVYLDGDVCIAADARIDDRDSLISELESSGRRSLKTATSAELILHAYHVWGENCVDHLLGDFAFILWDRRLRRVFCARDHLGVKPLYYAMVGRCLLISNTLDCIRQIPIVPGDLNDQAIGDFLIHAENIEPATTFFSAIHKVPAAHVLRADAGGLQTRRFWTLPVDEPVYYRRSGEYVDRLHDLLGKAVRDRLPQGPVGVFMSGGLDSPALAATAVRLGAPTTAVTTVFDRLVPDQERYYAGLVAEHLRIPIRFHVPDDRPVGWELDTPFVHTPEPFFGCLELAPHAAHFRALPSTARVFLYGEGPDDALTYEWRSYLDGLRRGRKWARLGRDIAFHVGAHHRIPLLSGLPRTWLRNRCAQPAGPDLLASLNQEFVSAQRLRERIRLEPRPELSGHPWRPVAYENFTSAIWPSAHEWLNAGHTGVAVDIRHPYLDLRVLRFLLAVPALPWCRVKYLFRRALRGVIPEAVRRRVKSPVPGCPAFERARRLPAPNLPIPPALERYVNRRGLPEWPGRDQSDYIPWAAALSLQYWLLQDNIR